MCSVIWSAQVWKRIHYDGTWVNHRNITPAKVAQCASSISSVFQQDQHAKQNNVPLNRTVGDWLRYGQLSKRLNRKDEAVRAFQQCANTGVRRWKSVDSPISSFARVELWG